jgi:hypothetical protein
MLIWVHTQIAAFTWNNFTVTNVSTFNYKTSDEKNKVLDFVSNIAATTFN